MNAQTVKGLGLDASSPNVTASARPAPTRPIQLATVSLTHTASAQRSAAPRSSGRILSVPWSAAFLWALAALLAFS